MSSGDKLSSLLVNAEVTNSPFDCTLSNAPVALDKEVLHLRPGRERSKSLGRWVVEHASCRVLLKRVVPEVTNRC